MQDFSRISLCWEVTVDWEGEVKGKAREAVVERRYRVPEGYLDDDRPD